MKTRLIPALGAEGAAALAANMLERIVAEAVAAAVGPVELCADPAPDHPDWVKWLPGGIDTSAQSDGDLGERMSAAARRVIASGETALLVGADCPTLDRSRLRAAAAALATHDVAVHPAQDGGYVLLGLARHDPSLFSGIEWSGPTVARETMARIAALGWTVDVRETLRDVDEAADLP